MKDFHHIEDDIRRWGLARGLHMCDQQSQFAQARKTQEEVGELFYALYTQDRHAIKDAIGDIGVTLIIQAAKHGVSFQECIEQAYQEIKDRKGQTVNGTFIKE